MDFKYLDPKTNKPYQRKQNQSPPVHGFHHDRNMEAVIENDRVVEHDAVINMLPQFQIHGDSNVAPAK